MKRIVYVTQRDIKLGKNRSYSFCPIARALKRIFKRKEVWVGMSTATLTRGERIRCMKLPQNVIDFINNFDKGIEVKPFNFFIYK